MTPSDVEIAVALAQHTEMLTHIRNEVRETKEQATRTNGRVTALERFKNQAQGAWFVASLAGPVITGLILKYA